MSATDMFVTYLMRNSTCESAPSAAKVHVPPRLLLQWAAMIAVHHQPETKSDAFFCHVRSLLSTTNSHNETKHTSESDRRFYVGSSSADRVICAW